MVKYYELKISLSLFLEMFNLSNKILWMLKAEIISSNQFYCTSSLCDHGLKHVYLK
ncbi:hypothetical protein VCRA217O315_170024 [Vibrio crassostreae]|nr:hypothetical protein VCRA217O315_170024 [Vibrio crassostreae]